MYCNHQHAFPADASLDAAAGDVLFWEGEQCKHIIALRSGIVRAVTISEDGERQILAFFFAGDQIGLPVSPAYRYTAETVTRATFVRNDVRHWRDALSQSCHNDGLEWQSIGLEQDPIYRRSILLGRQGAVARIAGFLCSIVDRLPRNRNGFDLPIPQLDIADHLALTPETVCRSLKRLRQFNIIQMPEYDRLVVEDRTKLEEAAQFPAAWKN